MSTNPKHAAIAPPHSAILAARAHHARYVQALRTGLAEWKRRARLAFGAASTDETERQVFASFVPEGDAALDTEEGVIASVARLAWSPAVAVPTEEAVFDFWANFYLLTAEVIGAMPILGADAAADEAQASGSGQDQAQ